MVPKPSSNLAAAFVFLAGPVLTLIGCGPEDRQLGFRSLPIVNGTPDTNPAHKAVAAVLLLSSQDPEKAGLCSSTLISPRVLLTAAHCVDSADPEDYLVSFESPVYIQTARKVRRVWEHPDHVYLTAFNDIAMLRLAEAAPADVKPIPSLPAALAITEKDIGADLEFVGFGLTDPDNERSYGTKMTMTNELHSVCENWPGCLVDYRFPVPQYSICQDQNPAAICFGDSGGPALVLRDGVEYVAGVASFGLGKNVQDYACHSKVDEYETEILAFLGQPAGAACAEDDACYSGYCIDGICCERACTSCETCTRPEFLGSCRPLADGLPCADRFFCNGDELCRNGQCIQGSPRDCDDQNPCTVDSCVDSTSTCLHLPETDGTPCPEEGVCGGGACRAPTPQTTLNPANGGGCASAASAGSQSGIGMPFALLAYALGLLVIRKRSSKSPHYFPQRSAPRREQ